LSFTESFMYFSTQLTLVALPMTYALEVSTIKICSKKSFSFNVSIEVATMFFLVSSPYKPFKTWIDIESFMSYWSTFYLVLSFLIYESSGLSLLKASNSNESTSKFFKSVLPLECFASF